MAYHTITIESTVQNARFELPVGICITRKSCTYYWSADDVPRIAASSGEILSQISPIFGSAVTVCTVILSFLSGRLFLSDALVVPVCGLLTDGDDAKNVFVLAVPVTLPAMTNVGSCDTRVTVTGIALFKLTELF